MSNTASFQPLPLASPIALLALEVAISQLGQKEAPGNKNTGPMVDKYLKAVGLNPGYPWCQAFVNWVYEEAAKAMGVPEPVINTGGVLACWNRTADSKKIKQADAKKRPEKILPGMQFILKLGAITGHTGIVERVEGNILHTIEGNSNNDGSREGYMVVRHKRKITDGALLGFIAY